MSTNLATILVGLGYDLSALEKGSPEAFRLISNQTLGMSAEMKRASREGAESLRLIDEALGIHLSRPLTRILTQEFPAFASGLQAVLGAGVIGAVGVAGFEFFEKIAKSIENAQKAEEDYAEAQRKTKDVFEDAMASYEKSAKLRELSGLSLSLFKIDSSSIEQAQKHIDDLAKSFDDLSKKELVASGSWEKFKAGIGDIAHTTFNTPTALSAEKLSKQTEQFNQQFDDLSKKDALKQTNESAKFLANELANAEYLLAQMQQHQMGTFTTFLRNQIPTTQTGQFGYSAEEIAQQTHYVEMLKQASQEKGAGTADQTAQENQAKAAAALEAQHEAIRELQGDLKGYNDEANKAWMTWLKINEQLEKSIAALGEGALPAAAARFAEFQKVFGVSQVGPPPGAPQLADQAELQKVTDDQNESWKKAGEILQQIETPLQKYNTALATLKQLEDQGRISTQQFAEAQALLQEQLRQSEDRMQKLLEKGGVSGGLKAFMMQLNGEAGKGSGQFTFNFLNQAMQGFEDETAKALTGAKTHWMDFFESLDQMALKFMLNKLFSQLLGPALGGLFGGIGGGGSSGAPFGGGFNLPPGSFGAPPGFALGTDFAPGGMAWVGEDGPELLNLPTGASITPASAARGGGSPIIHIDARGGEIGVEEKIARAMSDAMPHMVMRAIVEANEVQRRSVR